MNFADVTVGERGGMLWAENAGLTLEVPPTNAERLRRHVGERVTLGIRPEDLHPATGADSADYAFDAVVDVVEPLGSEILLDIKAGPTAMVARVDPSVRVKVHEKIRLALEPERVHFFDVKTESAI
jgi:multiple sugar transport system ATP-binding protein